jgi:two-component system, NarL family, invasion response regulator UvrY
MDKYRVIRVVIVDDNEVLCTSLVEILGFQDDMQVIGWGRTGEDAISLCANLQPDVVLMDLRMPSMDGVTATKIIHAYDPAILIIIYASGEGAFIQQALDAGAVGQIPKVSDVKKILAAIRGAYQAYRT